MKPPAFQFYADDFIGGVSDMTQSEVGAYILLLCHQWNRGSIPVQPDRQKLIARGDVTAHVVSKFKQGSDGELRNERLESERQKQAEYREKQRVKGVKSGISRGTTVEPRLNSGCDLVGTEREPEGNSPSPSPSPSPISREREKGLPETPPMSRKDFDALADMRAIPKDCAERFWNTYDSRNWVDSQGIPVRKVEPLLLNYVSSWRANNHQKQAEQSTPQVSGANTVQMGKEYERVIARITQIQNGSASDAMGSKFYTPKEKSELATLKKRKQELKGILGIVV